MKGFRFPSWLWLAGILQITSSVSAAAEIQVSSGPVILTLTQCLSLALDHATLVLKARNANEVSGTELLQAYLQFLPNLELAGGYAWQSGRENFTATTPTPISTTRRDMNYQLSSTLNLFNGFGDTAGLASSRRHREGASLTLYRAKQQIMLDVTQAYLQVILDRRIMQFADANLKSSRQRESLLSAQSEVGSRSLADLYRQQAQTSADELSSIQAVNTAHDDLLSLLRRIRADLRLHYDLVEVAIGTNPVSNPYTQESPLIAQALDQRPDLRAARNAAEASSWDVVTVRSGYFPRLDLVAAMAGAGARLDRQIVDGIDILPVPQDSFGKQLGTNILYSAGVNLNWGLFDRYLTRLNVARATATAKNSQIDYEDLKLQVEGDVQQAMGDYQAALQQIDVSRHGLRAAEESFEAVQERYKVGASSIVDLLTAQAALVQAQSNEARSGIGFILQGKVMENVLGTTVPGAESNQGRVISAGFTNASNSLSVR